MTEAERVAWLADTTDTLRTYISSGHAADEHKVEAEWMLKEWEAELEESRAALNRNNTSDEQAE